MNSHQSRPAGAYAPAPATSPLALQGVRVIEMGQLIAGPFAGKTLGEFGADVIKIEAPGDGDPLRNWRLIQDGTSVWWQVQSRNKRSIALDLRSSEGQDIARRLIADADVLIENFRPGTLEGWGMGYEVLSKLNPGLVMLRISGYGLSACSASQPRPQPSSVPGRKFSISTSASAIRRRAISWPWPPLTLRW